MHCYHLYKPDIHRNNRKATFVVRLSLSAQHFIV